MNDLKLIYTIDEVASIIQTNKNYVYSLVKANLIRPLKLGRYKIRHDELLRFLEDYEGYDLTDPFNPRVMDNG